MTRRALSLVCAVAASLLCAPPVQAQSRLVCALNAGVPPIVRGEGTRELATDMVLICQGGIKGQNISTDILVETSTAITGKRVGDYSESLLIHQEAMAADAYNSHTIQIVQGRVIASNRLRFPVTFAAPGAETLVYLRITNLRIDASAIWAVADRTQHLPPFVFGSVIVTNPAVVTSPGPEIIAFLQPGFNGSIFSPATGILSISACSPNSQAFPAGANPDFYIRFREGFADAFKTAINSAGKQNIPGVNYQTESGFHDPSLPLANGMNLAGRATHSTRLIARFRNVPSGVTLYTTLKPNYPYGSAAHLLAPDGTQGVALTQAIIEDFPAAVAAIPVVNGHGEAVWEIRETSGSRNEHLEFPVFASYTAGVVPSMMSVELALGPVDDPQAFPSFTGFTERKFWFRPCGATLPDLRVLPSSTSLSGPSGGTVVVSAVIENQGGDSPAFQVRFRLAPGYISDYTGGPVSVLAPPLRAGSSTTVSASVPLKPEHHGFDPSRPERIQVFADSAQEVIESSESNNEQFFPLRITNCVFGPPSTIVYIPPSGRDFPLFESPCPLETTSNSAWLTLDRVAPNDTPFVRIGHLAVNGHRVRIVQFPSEVHSTFSCVMVMRPHAIAVTEDGTSGSLELASGRPCRWHLASDADWLQVSSATGVGDGQIRYTVFPNFSTRPREAHLSRVAYWRGVDVTQEAGAGSSDERFIRLLYFNFMGRLPSDAEVAFQLNNTLRLGWTRAELATTFFNSSEFNNGGRFAAGLYVGLLDRNAEYDGWLYQRNALATNVVRPLQLVAGFLGSPEYTLKFGSPDNAVFVRLLYRHVLLREATQAEVNFQAGALASGATRAQIATNFLNSAEFRAGTGPRLTAFLLYSTLLFRDASSTEFETTRTQVAAGANVTGLIHSFTSGPEFARVLE